jgi:pimeloyl-ACP methyl ester carboxylesterase
LAVLGNFKGLWAKKFGNCEILNLETPLPEPGASAHIPTGILSRLLLIRKCLSRHSQSGYSVCGRSEKPPQRRRSNLASNVLFSLQDNPMLLVRTYGESGRLVMLLHGGPGAPGDMAAVARGLSDSHRVLEPYQRGGGGGPLSVARHVDDLHEVVNFYAPESPPTLLGSSWGAMLALAYAAAHPTSVASLILVGCGTFDVVARAKLHENLAQRMNDEVREGLARAELAPDEDERLRARAEAELSLYAYDPMALPQWETVDAQGHLETWNDMLRLQAEGIYPAAFATIKVPMLMVHGAYDPAPGRLIRDGLLLYTPQLEYHEFEHCGHWPWLEKSASQEFFSLVREWLARRGTGDEAHHRFV